MRQLDQQEVLITRELIKNPRISDNKISKNTKIPVMTVNRKRKKLEEEMLIRYYASTNKHERGMGIFGAKQLYIIKLRIGITRQEYIKNMEGNPKWRRFNSKYISQTYLGEKDGHLAMVMILDAPSEKDMVEEFNGKIVSFIKEKMGEDCIKEIITTSLNQLIRVHHNYLPDINMRNGIIKKEWPDDQIFVNEIEEKPQPDLTL